MSDRGDDAGKHIGQRMAGGLKHHGGDAEQDGDDARIGEYFFQQRGQAVAFVSGVQTDAVGPHADAQRDGIDRGIQDAFVSKGGFADHHAQGPGIVGGGAEIEVDAFLFGLVVFPQEAADQNKSALNEDGDHKDRQAGADDPGRDLCLKCMKDGAWQDQVHDKKVELGCGLFCDPFLFAEQQPDEQIGEDLDLHRYHVHGSTVAEFRAFL